MNQVDKSFISNVNRLEHICLDPAEVQHSKDTLYYKFTEMIANIFSYIWGSNSITKAENILENRVTTPTLENQINQKLTSLQNKFPDLKEIIDQEKREIKDLLSNLKLEFKTERDLLEMEKQQKKQDPETIKKYQDSVQSMADKFLEFEESLRITSFKTDHALLSQLINKLKDKYNDIDHNVVNLNVKLSLSIIDTRSFQDLNKAAGLLNKIEIYAKQLKEMFDSQKQKLELFGISPSVQKKIADQQSQSLKHSFESLEKNDSSVLDTQYTDLLFNWSDDAVFGMAYEYVIKEHQTQLNQTLDQLENTQLREFVRKSADGLFKEADEKLTIQEKITHLDWMESQLADGMRNFLKQEVDKLDILLDRYSGKLSGDLQLDPADWKASVKNVLNQKINEVKDAGAANALAKEINELKEFEKFNLFLNPMEQLDILDRQKNFEIKELEKKFPKKRTDLMLGFLGESGKGTLLEQISQKLVLASQSTSIETKEKAIETKEKAITEINLITEERIVEELKEKVREKSQEIIKQKNDDIAIRTNSHASLVSNYPWIADEKESPAMPAMLEQYQNTLNSSLIPNIQDLDYDKELLKMITYVQNNLINTQANIQKSYADKKKEASDNYTIQLQQQIAKNLRELLVPTYQAITKEAQNNEENLAVFNNFIKTKTREMASAILQTPAEAEKYKNLKAEDFENELRADFQSSLDKMFDSWFS